MKNLTIIGGGPAALMLAAELDSAKYRVTLYDQKKTVGRKFLVAGEGGLNLTYSSSIEDLISSYSPSDFMAPALRAFSNEDLRDWLEKEAVPTFVGSSNRVFPKKGIKPIEVLKRIKSCISSNNVVFKLGVKWLGWNEEGHLHFDNDEIVNSDLVVFALGGASWKVTGSDGNWAKTFENKGIYTKPFRAANCAFEVNWVNDFLEVYEGNALKNIALSFEKKRFKGELTISKFGLEGNAIYPLSEEIQKAFVKQEKATIFLDLKPTMSVEQLNGKYERSKRKKITDILNKDLNLDRCSIALLKQVLDKEQFLNPAVLVATIKAIPIAVRSADLIDRAISTLGGVELKEIDENFQCKKIPNTYCIGEMLDWYAPTGGYLLQGCFSMGFTLAKHLNALD